MTEAPASGNAAGQTVTSPDSPNATNQIYIAATSRGMEDIMKEVKTLKATGIVWRIDDLGRVRIPKEIRRILGIREGDPLEIFLDKEGEAILIRKRIAE